MTSARQEIQTGLDRVRSRFLSALDDRLDVLEVNVDRIGPTPEGRQALLCIKSEVHKIAGTAEILGFGQLGRIAAKLDAAIGATNSQAISGEALSDIKSDVERLLEDGAALLQHEDLDRALTG